MLASISSLGRPCIVTLRVLILAFGAALSQREQIGAGLVDRRWGLMFPGLGLLAMAGAFIGVRERRDGMPFAMTVVFLSHRSSRPPYCSGPLWFSTR